MTDRLTEDAIVRALEAMGLVKADDATVVERLPDQDQRPAYRVCTDGGELLVRSADQATCAAAHLYATAGARCVPDYRRKVLGHDAERGIVVEEWLDPGKYKSLAQELLHEPTTHGYSTPFRADEFSEIDFKELLRDVGETIGKIHAGTRGFGQIANDAKTPATQPLETFLRVARTYPHLANRLRGIAEQSARVEPVLLHGCLSPDSILFGEEVGFDEDHAIISPNRIASGDPAIDLAHMMAYLFVASVNRVSTIFVEVAGYFHAGYAGTIDEGPGKLSIMQRAGPLTAAFMLALLDDERVSSVLDPHDKDFILAFSQWWLGRRDYTLGQVRDALWFSVDYGVILDCKQFESLPRAEE